MKKNRLFLLFVILFLSFASAEELEEAVVISNSAGGTEIFEGTQEQLDYIGLDTKGSRDINPFSTYDDTELKKAISENANNINKLIGLLEKDADGWIESTLPDGTKVRKNADGDIEVWDPVTGKWVPIDQLSKEQRDKILEQMRKQGLITQAEMDKIKEKIDNGWIESTLPDGTKVRKNADGDIEVWDPVTGKWVPIDQLSKEQRDKILEQMRKQGLITQAEMDKIKEKIDNGWTESTLPDGTKVRKNADGDIEVWDPVTGKWVPIDQLSKEQRDKILEQMRKQGLITQAEMDRIKKKIAEAEVESLRKQGIDARVVDNGNGTYSVQVFKGGKWVDVDDLSSKDKKEIDDILNDKKDKTPANNKDDVLIDGKAGYIDEEGNRKKYTKEDKEKWDEKNGNGGEENKQESPSVVPVSDVPIDDRVNLTDEKIREGVELLRMLQKNKEQVDSRRMYEATSVVQADAIPIFDQLVAINKQEILDSQAKEETLSDIKDIALCDLDVLKQVISATEHMEITCSSKNLGDFVLLVELKTELKDNIPTLTGSAKEITFSMDKYINDENYNIKESLVLNAYTKNSNIATRVNMKKFERFLSKTGKDSYEIGKESVNKYTDALSSSLDSESTTTDATTGDKTVETSSVSPKFMDYLTPSGIQIAMAVIGNGVDIFFSDSPIMYEIDKSTRFKIYMTLTKGKINETQNN